MTNDSYLIYNFQSEFDLIERKGDKTNLQC